MNYQIYMTAINIRETIKLCIENFDYSFKYKEMPNTDFLKLLVELEKVDFSKNNKVNVQENFVINYLESYKE